MALITVGELLLGSYVQPPAELTGSINSYRFAFFDNTGNQFSSAASSVTDQILNSAVKSINGVTGNISAVSSINGCTGNIGITGSENEIIITKNCPNIVIGLPDNVVITGDLQVNGNINNTAVSIIDGGLF
jgi:hypothetical protein